MNRSTNPFFCSHPAVSLSSTLTRSAGTRGWLPLLPLSYLPPSYSCCRCFCLWWLPHPVQSSCTITGLFFLDTSFMSGRVTRRKTDQNKPPSSPYNNNNSFQHFADPTHGKKYSLNIYNKFKLIENKKYIKTVWYIKKYTKVSEHNNMHVKYKINFTAAWSWKMHEGSLWVPHSLLPFPVKC